MFSRAKLAIEKYSTVLQNFPSLGKMFKDKGSLQIHVAFFSKSIGVVYSHVKFIPLFFLWAGVIFSCHVLFIFLYIQNYILLEKITKKGYSQFQVRFEIVYRGM